MLKYNSTRVGKVIKVGFRIQDVFSKAILQYKTNIETYNLEENNWFITSESEWHDLDCSDLDMLYKVRCFLEKIN